MSENNEAAPLGDMAEVKEESSNMTGHIEICFYGKKANTKIEATIEQTIYAYTNLVVAIHKNTDDGFMIGLFGKTIRYILENDGEEPSQNISAEKWKNSLVRDNN